MTDNLIIDILELGPYFVNCYIVGDSRTKKGIIIDPSWEPERIYRHDLLYDLRRRIRSDHLHDFVVADPELLVVAPRSGDLHLEQQVLATRRRPIAAKRHRDLIVDGPPTKGNPLARYPALKTLYDKLSPEAVILVDDMIRPGEKEMVRRWLAEYPDLRAEHLETEVGTAILRRVPD